MEPYETPHNTFPGVPGFSCFENPSDSLDEGDNMNNEVFELLDLGPLICNCEFGDVGSFLLGLCFFVV